MAIPESILSLHADEEILREKSLEAIENDTNLLSHLFMIKKSMDLINYFAVQYCHDENEDLSTIQLLGIQLFNGSASALNMLLCGYYQASVLQQRNLLETIFLLDYFRTDKKLISIWRKSDKRKRMKEFKPVKIRKALDTRDGFTERKREKAYSLLCELAGHPTPSGFQMLTPVPGGDDAHCGPFFEFTAMKVTLEELAKKLVEAGTIFTRFFNTRNRADFEMKIIFAKSFRKWSEKFYDKPMDPKLLEELHARASLLPD